MQAIATSVIPKYEYRATDILLPEQAIKKAAVLLQIGKPINALLQNHPALNQVCLNLARIVTNLFPSSDTNKPLLAAALFEALQAYRQGAHSGDDPRDLPAIFLDALIERATDVTSYDVHAIDGMGMGERWETLRSPLIEWVAAHPDKRIVFTERATDKSDKDIARMVIIGQIMTMRDARLLIRRATSHAVYGG